MSKNKDSEVETEDKNVEKDAELDERVNRVVNAAVSAHLTRVKGALSKDFEGLLAGALKPVTDTISRLEAAHQSKSTAQGDSGSRDEVIQGIERAKYDDRIRELEERYKAAESAREAEQKARQRDEERSALADALRKGGVDDARIRPAVALLYTEEQRVSRDDANKIVMKMNGKYGEEHISLDEAVTTWLKSDDGKMFLPPRGAGGSGSNFGTKNGQSFGNPKDKKAAARAAALAVLQSFSLRDPSEEE